MAEDQGAEKESKPDAQASGPVDAPKAVLKQPGLLQRLREKIARLQETDDNIYPLY